MTAKEMLQYHVSGAVERGEAESIVAVDMQTIQKCLTEFVGVGGVKVTTVHAKFGKITDAEYHAGATAVEVIATSDGGRYAEGQWHREEIDGAFADESVYVERYTAAGREFHGFIDKVSRKLVQTG